MRIASVKTNRMRNGTRRRCDRAARALSLVPFIALLGATAIGCGGGSPLLHPAHALPRGEVRATTGFSSQVPAFGLRDDLTRARDIAGADPNAPGAPGTNPDYARGALVSAAVAPGLAPFVSGRVGLGHETEAGLAYTGRGARVDIRRAFPAGAITYSLGIGGSAAFSGRQQGNDLPNVELGALRGYGVDVPALVGWRSTAGLYMAWAGVRAGFERLTIGNLSSEPRDPTLVPRGIELDANRFHAGPVLGVAAGLGAIHVGLELAASYNVASGTYNETSATVRGVAFTPATAIWWDF
jgi:hypothetical protein